MSLQVCSCGWSKVTTYHGLRTHQGKMGCTPKGMRIPESEQFRVYSGFTLRPTIKADKPLADIFTPPIKSVGEHNTWRSPWEEPINSTPVKKEIITTSDMSLQVCSCGWSKVTTYHGLRTHQGKMGCTPKGMRIPESEQFRLNCFPGLTLRPTIEVDEPLADIFTPPIKSMGERNTWRSLWEEPINSTPVKKESFLTPMSQTHSIQTGFAATEAILREAKKSLFETPQHSYQTATQARRALDFSAGAQQVGQLVWDLPTMTAHETAVQQREKEREKEREAQKQLKARQDRIRADLQQKLQMREQKMAEVRSSVNACKGSLDTEWLEINNVFSEVMRVVEGTWKKALQPLEERRRRLKREEEDLVKKLQKETDKLKMALDELDRNPDLQDSPLTGLDESRDWKNVTVNSSSSLGTLRSTTSNMMEQIQQKLEKLSSVELRRIPTFAVDVKLDPTTAHQCLVLSPDGKAVRDGGKNQKFPDAPGRFDMFGSVLGLNRLTSGKSYWEVEVSNKTGWDLGVARHNANRKGKLSLTPDNGYWVTVHYENEKYAALSAPPVSLPLKEKPQRVGVFVDYEEGLVSFYDVTAQSHIYSFTECSFRDEIRPYFSPHLIRNEKNSNPLVISESYKL